MLRSPLRKPDFRSASGPCERGLATDLLDLYGGGALSFWEWLPRENRLVTHGEFRADSLEEWMMRIHPRDQAAFSEFLDHEWAASSHRRIDYRLNAGAPGDWIRVRHTAGPIRRDGEDLLSGLVEELSSPQLTRTLLERSEGEMREGESRLGRFIGDSLSHAAAGDDPKPLLDLLRGTLRSDLVSFVHLDARLAVVSQCSSAVGDAPFDGEKLRNPLLEVLASGNEECFPEVLELDLNTGEKEISRFLVRPLLLPGGQLGGALCAGFRTSGGRETGRRFAPLLSLAAHILAGRLGREQEGAHRRDLLSQLRKAQRHSGLGRLTGGFAHELKNHLTVIQGHLHLLAEALASGDHEGGLDSLNQIRAVSEQASDFSNRLLSLGGQTSPDMKRCDLNGVIERFVTMMRRVLEENIAIRLDLDPSIPPIRADEGLLREVLLNLLVNARDAMPRGGGITISTRGPAGAGAPEGTFVSLRIADDGPGGRGRRLPCLPDPFVPEDAGRHGSSLELYHVASIVAEHGGQVVPEPEAASRGHVFHLLFPAVELPAAEAAETTGENSAEPAEPNGDLLRGTTVLLVEDETAVRKLVRKLLEMLGCSVVEAVSGRQALELWPEVRQRVSLVVSDVVMPEGVSGWDLARDLHHRHPQLGILLTSGYSETPADHGLGEIPQIAYLQKPYRVNELKGRLLALVSTAS